MDAIGLRPGSDNLFGCPKVAAIIRRPVWKQMEIVILIPVEIQHLSDTCAIAHGTSSRLVKVDVEGIAVHDAVQEKQASGCPGFHGSREELCPY